MLTIELPPHSGLKYDENHSELELHDLAVENTHIGHHQYKGHQNTKPAFNSNYTKNQRVNSVAEGYNAHTGFNPHGQNSAAHGPPRQTLLLLSIVISHVNYLTDIF